MDLVPPQGNMSLTSDHVGGVTFNPVGFKPDGEADAAIVNLNGHTITVDSKGLHNWNPNWSYIRGEGSLTSNQRFIDIVNHVTTGREIDLGNNNKRWDNHGLILDTAITDSTHAVGLRISGKRPAARAAVVYLKGTQSNTFTGDVEISGGSNYLVLAKEAGAVAIRGNIHVSDWGVIRFDENQQVSGSTVITLRRATLYFGPTMKHISTHFHQLKIEDRGIVRFGGKDHKYQRYLYLDELVINSKGYLDVFEWEPGRDYFLVSKKMDKGALDALLTKIRFQGWAPGQTHLEDYNNEYWSISGLPEPATYGAIFGGIGLGIIAWRRRKGARPRALDLS